MEKKAEWKKQMEGLSEAEKVAKKKKTKEERKEEREEDGKGINEAIKEDVKSRFKKRKPYRRFSETTMKGGKNIFTELADVPRQVVRGVLLTPIK